MKLILKYLSSVVLASSLSIPATLTEAADVGNTLSSETVLSADFTQIDTQIGLLYDFFDVAVRTERGNPKSKPATFGRRPKVNTVRMLGGWRNQDLAGDTYLWDGEKYTYNFAAATKRIDGWIDNEWDIFQIVLDNPPWAFQRGYAFVDEPDGEHYLKKDKVGVYGNGLPPNDTKAWNKYIQDFISHLVARYGKERVSSWRFRVGSEIDTRPQHWAATREEFFEHYRNTVEAVKSVLPDAKVGAHFREASHQSRYVDYTGNKENAYAPYFVSWAKQNNVPYDFLAISYYPHITHKHEMDMEHVYAEQFEPILGHADFNANASFEIHEYKFIVKMKRGGFVSVATSHNTAFFAMLSKLMLERGIKKVFQWGNQRDGSYSPEAMTQLALHGMLGNSVFKNATSNVRTEQGNRVDGIFSQRLKGEGIDVLTFNFNNENISYLEPEPLKLAMKVDKPAGTKFQYRVAQIDRETNIEQQFFKDFPKASILESEGGWRKADAHPTASVKNSLNKEGQAVYLKNKDKYKKMDSLEWSDWRIEEIDGTETGSEVVIKNLIPSFAVQKYEIRWL